MKIRILVFDGADELDFIGPYEVFRRAAKLDSEIDVALAALAPQGEITAAHGLRVRPDSALRGPVDLLVVPGGGWVNRASRGVRAELERGELPGRVASLYSQGTMVAGVCTGAMALWAAGLLRGRPATTHRDALEDLHSTSAQVVHARVVDAGDIVTCGGVTSSIDLALWLVERFCGEEIANRVASDMEYHRSSDIYVSGVQETQTA